MPPPAPDVPPPHGARRAARAGGPAARRCACGAALACLASLVATAGRAIGQPLARVHAAAAPSRDAGPADSARPPAAPPVPADTIGGAAPIDSAAGATAAGATAAGPGAPPAADSSAHSSAERVDALRERLDRAGLGWAGRLLADSSAAEAAARGAAARRTQRPRVPCAGQRVNDIVVLAQPPYAGGVLARLEFVERAVRELHATTRERVIRRFLLLQVGDACDELRRSESERILRVQPYIVDARITAFADPNGGVVLEVETRDEFSVVASVNLRTQAPPVSAVRLGESNLMGQAVNLTGEWYDGGIGYRDAMGIHLTDHQLFGRPYQLVTNVVRREVGGWWTGEVTQPFYTDLQRVAWRVSGGRADEFIDFRRPDRDQRDALGVSRRFADVGGVIRIGAPGRLSLFGLSMTVEHERVADRYVQLTDTGVVRDVPPPDGVAARARYSGQQVTRLNALWGVRNVRFLRVTGFDALTGVQDVRRGFQLSTLFGRALSVLGSDDDDIHVSTDVYLGLGSQSSFLAVQLSGEGRQDFDRNRWDGIVAGGRGVWYLVPHDRHRIVTELQYGGAWRERVPYQLSLADRWGGVRGYRESREGGARRALARTEYRAVFGRLFGLGDVGAGAFVDVGKLWAGDVPYGVTTPLRSSAGVSVLAAVPPRSRRMWRADFAFPLQRDAARRSWEVRVSNRDLTRLFYREPDDVRMARERAVPGSVFTWR